MRPPSLLYAGKSLVKEDLHRDGDQQGRIDRAPDQDPVGNLLVGLAVYLDLLFQAYHHVFHGSHFFGSFVHLTDVPIVVYIAAKVPHQFKDKRDESGDKAVKTGSCHLDS